MSKWNTIVLHSGLMLLNNFYWSVVTNPYRTVFSLEANTKTNCMRWPLKALFLLQTIHVDVTIVLQSQKLDGNKQTLLKWQLLKRSQLSPYLAHCKRVCRLIHETLLYDSRQSFLVAKRIKWNLASFGDRNAKPVCVPQYWHRAENWEQWLQATGSNSATLCEGEGFSHVIWDVTHIWITKRSRSIFTPELTTIVFTGKLDPFTDLMKCL